MHPHFYSRFSTIGAILALTVSLSAPLAAPLAARPQNGHYLNQQAEALAYEARNGVATAQSEAGWGGDFYARQVVNAMQAFSISCRQLAITTRRYDPYSRQQAIQIYNQAVMQHRQVNYALARANRMVRTRYLWNAVTSRMITVERALRRWGKQAGINLAMSPESSLPSEVLEAVQGARVDRFNRLHAGL